MGFSSSLDKVSSPATKYPRWKGGVDKIRNVDGSIDTVGGKLLYWDKDKADNVELALPLVICPLEITYRYGGFKKDSGRIWSNEIIDFSKTYIRVHLTGETDDVICQGYYNDISEAAYAKGAKLQINLYAYVPSTEEIMCFNLTGSAKTAWKEFARKKNIYANSVIINQGEVKKSQLGEFIPPKFVLGEAYDDDSIKQLRVQDELILDYLKYNEKNNEAPSEVEVSEVPIAPQESPAVESQESLIVPMEDDSIDLSEIPF